MAFQLLYMTFISSAEVCFARLSTIRTHLSESRLVCVHQSSITFPSGAHSNLSFLGNIHDGLSRHVAQIFYGSENQTFVLWDERMRI